MLKRRKTGSGGQKLAALLLSVFIALSGTGPAFAAQREALVRPADGWYEPKEHTRLDYSEIEYEGFDRSRADAGADELEALCAGPRTGEGEMRARELYRILVEETDRMATQYALIDLAHCKDVSDGDAASELAKLDEIYTEVDDRCRSVLSAALNSPYGDVLRDEMGVRAADMLREYRPVTEREAELLREETELVMEYDSEALRLEEAGAGVRERNEALGAIFLELTAVRTAVAREEGYDNYADYAYDVIYDRDFTKDDAAVLYREVKEAVVPLCAEIVQVCGGEGFQDALFEIADSTAAERLSAIAPYVGEVDADLKEAFSYLTDRHLYDMEEEEKKAAMGFTTYLYSYGTPFIFDSPYGDVIDYNTAIHEFGHFNAMYHELPHALFEEQGLDVSEIHSQGLELLFTPFAEELFGDAGKAFRCQTVLGIVSSVIDGCLEDEFQNAVYAAPDMTLAEMNQLYLELSLEYGYTYSERQTEAYGWVDIPHTFQSPLYYISYATSALPALDIWTEAEEDWESGVNKYMALTAMGTEAPYREALETCGLLDIFEEGSVAEIAAGIPGALDLGGTARYYGDAPGISTAPAVLIGAFVAAVLLAVCVLLLRKRRQARQKTDEAGNDR